MSELNCQICLISFDREVHLPRLLLCGHTICTECLTKILATSKACPNCRKETDSSDINDYQTNFTLTEIMDSVGKLLNSKENFVQKYREKLVFRQLELEEQMIMLKSLKDNISLNITNGEKIEEQLIALIELCDPFEIKSIEELTELDEKLDTISCNNELDKSCLMKDVSLKSDDFASTAMFVAEIHNIMTQHRSLIAVLRVDGMKKFAKLSKIDNLLFIHSFERYQKTEYDVVVCFQDLMNIVLRTGEAKCIFAFFDLSFNADKFSRRVLINISTSTSYIGSQFLKLCTGELGRSYKGLSFDQKYGEVTSSYEIDRIVQLKNFGWDMKEVDNYSTYFLAKGDNSTTCLWNNCYLVFGKDGSFEIFRCTELAKVQAKVQSRVGFPCPNIIGSIVDLNKDFHSTFKDATHRKILDCGIAIQW